MPVKYPFALNWKFFVLVYLSENIAVSIYLVTKKIIDTMYTVALKG